MRILAFGIAKDIIGTTELDFEVPPNSTVLDLKKILFGKYEKLAQLSSLSIALDETYANDEQLIKPENVVALIPPVSGG